ncbi:MAG: hypothetical protein PHQ05_13195 [Sterolibacterium sp.]|nr:hypothetical protein [Sterolibacterium sp.]
MSKAPTRNQVDAALRFYAAGRIVKHAARTPTEVPPFCFLRPGVNPEKATAKAAQALGVTDPAGLVTMLWVMQAVAECRQ